MKLQDTKLKLEEKYKRELRELENNLKQKNEEKLKEYIVLIKKDFLHNIKRRSKELSIKTLLIQMK